MSDVCHAWAHATKESMRGGNVHFAGEVIYSYGSHFPMARRIGDLFLYTTSTHSVSTSKHLSRCLSAIPHGATVYRVRDVTANNAVKHTENYVDRLNDIQVWLERAGRARTNKGQYLYNAQDAEENIIAYARWAGVHEEDIMPPVTQRVDIKAMIAESREQRKIREAKKLASLVAGQAKQLADWYAGGTTYGSLVLEDGTVPLRLHVNGEDIETGQGACVSARDAVLLGARWGQIRAGIEGVVLPERIGSYKVIKLVSDNDIMEIGCHRISWTEWQKVSALIAERGE